VVTWNNHIPDPDNPAQPRQIDVTIKRDGALTLVECRQHKSKQNVKWIEELMGRRISLGAQGVIAVSSSGFTAGAVNKAKKQGIILRDLQQLTEQQHRGEIIAGLKQLKSMRSSWGGLKWYLEVGANGWITFAVAFAIFVTSLFSEFIRDDPWQIVKNPQIQSWSYLPRLFSTHLRSQSGSEHAVHFYRAVVFRVDAGGKHHWQLISCLVTFLQHVVARIHHVSCVQTLREARRG
jgi:hypothetical protein